MHRNHPCDVEDIETFETRPSLMSESSPELRYGHLRGSSASLRHLRRSAGVSVAWLHEYWCADDRCSDPSQKREPGSGARRTKHQSGLDLEPDCLTKALGKDQTDRYNASFGLAEEAEGETE